MVIDEGARHRLHQRLDRVLGPDEATTLMAHLPPVGWADVTTKHDIHALERATKQDLEAIRGEIRALAAGTKQETQGLRQEIKAVERVLKADIASLGSELRVEIAHTRADILRYSILANSATLLAIFGMLVATGRLA